MSHILPNQMDQSHEIEEFWENDEINNLLRLSEKNLYSEKNLSV